MTSLGGGQSTLTGECGVMRIAMTVVVISRRLHSSVI
jgi:hypothetical protein